MDQALDSADPIRLERRGRRDNGSDAFRALQRAQADNAMPAGLSESVRAISKLWANNKAVAATCVGDH
jgi:hypothetical protein